MGYKQNSSQSARQALEIRQKNHVLERTVGLDRLSSPDHGFHAPAPSPGGASATPENRQNYGILEKPCQTT